MAQSKKHFILDVFNEQDVATIKVFEVSDKKRQVADIHVGIYDGKPRLMVTAKKLFTEILNK